MLNRQIAIYKSRCLVSFCPGSLLTRVFAHALRISCCAVPWKNSIWLTPPSCKSLWRH